LPLYEYQCKKCHSLTERIQKFSDEPLTVCPHCGGELEKLISAPAVQFKGSGWYVTDYAKKPSGESSKSESSSSSGSSGGDSSSSSSGSESSGSGSSKPDSAGAKDSGKKKK
jgi:putative FmdB family regulatory protein